MTHFNPEQTQTNETHRSHVDAHDLAGLALDLTLPDLNNTLDDRSEIDHIGSENLLDLLETTNNPAALELASALLRDEPGLDKFVATENLDARGVEGYRLSFGDRGLIEVSDTSVLMAEKGADFTIITDRHTMFPLPTGMMCKVPLEQGPYIRMLISSCSVLVATTVTDLIVAHIAHSNAEQIDTALEFMKNSGVDPATIRVVANTDTSSPSSSSVRVSSIEDYTKRGVAADNIVTYAARGRQEGDDASRPGPVEVMVNSTGSLARRLRTVRMDPSHYLGYLENEPSTEI